MEIKFPACLENDDRLNDATDQPTDRPGHREDSLPLRQKVITKGDFFT